MTDAAGIDGSPRAAARTRPDQTSGAGASKAATGAEARSTRAILGAAIVAVAVLVLLMPATPLVAFLLMASVALGAVAVVVRRAEERRSAGEGLERLATKGYLVLADRRSPALTGSIGQLVVGPSGVYLIETRDHPGRVRIRGEQLVIGGHSYDVASHLRAQVAAVSAVLAPVLDGSGATVVPLVCIGGAELPLLRHDVAGIPLLRESQLARRISRSRPLLDQGTVTRLSERIDQMMPRVDRRRTPTGVDLTGPAVDGEPVPGGGTTDAFGYGPDQMSLSAS